MTGLRAAGYTVDMQKEDFHFSQDVSVGIRDINYGGHVGNDVYLSYCQEARIAYLREGGLSEMDIGGSGIIMVRSTMEYRSELFHGDRLRVYCRVAELKNTSFVMEHLIEKLPSDGGEPILALTASTVLVAFDYQARKVVRVPDEFRAQVERIERAGG